MIKKIFLDYSVAHDYDGGSAELKTLDEARTTLYKQHPHLEGLVPDGAGGFDWKHYNDECYGKQLSWGDKHSFSFLEDLRDTGDPNVSNLYKLFVDGQEVWSSKEEEEEEDEDED
jgi:hypothetical protein